MTENKYFRLFLFLIVSLFVIKKTGLSLPVNITTSQVSSELSVVGEGKVDATPDTSYVDISVVVNGASSATEAQNQITAKNNSIIKAVVDLGVKAADIKTSNFSVSPNYNYTNGQNSLSGYNGNVTLSVKTTDFSLTPKIIEAATAAGANQIEGTRFVVDDPEKYREQARDKAIANAKDQAAKLANSLGITLGRVNNIVESTPSTPVYFQQDKTMTFSSAAASAPTPDLQPGQQTITSVVTLFFDKN